MADHKDNRFSHRRYRSRAIAAFFLFALLMTIGFGCSESSRYTTGLRKVQHIIVLIQENHSFDNYFGVLPYVPGGPYHAPAISSSACRARDHTCVNGLSCSIDSSSLECSNSNVAMDGSIVLSHHDSNYCVKPDLDHTWHGAHRELNYSDPNDLGAATSDGFVRVNEKEEGNKDDTMGYYDQDDLPYYYALAQTFAISDSYFCDVPSQTHPNRFYSLAATSFGHLVTGEPIPAEGFKPINGTIFDLLDANGVHWSAYYDPGGGDEYLRPFAKAFRPTSPNYLTMSQFYTDAAAGNLAQVVWIDLEHDEHPPSDIRAGQQEVAQVISAIRSSPAWSSSIVFLTYDEHGGAYDHVRPPAATPPDSVPPGLCADNSNPPLSRHPGHGAECAESFAEALSLCPLLPPYGPFPADCAAFGRFGVRVPLVAISPFAKPAYVSHVVSDHTSFLALIEKRFLQGRHLTRRDAAASTLEDLFDFKHAPSAASNVPASLAEPPAPDHNCP